MTPTLLLTQSELCDLTGYKQPAAQLRWLAKHQIQYLVGDDGKIKVLRQIVVDRLGTPDRPAVEEHVPKLRLTTKTGRGGAPK